MSDKHVSTTDELLTDEKVLWDSIVAEAATTFRLNEDETERLRENKLVRLFGLLPYFADCPRYEVVGLLNVITYITERRVRRELSAHTEADDFDYLNRFQAFRNLMRGGDEEVIEKGLAMAGLVMLNDYLHDMEEDSAKGKYNPLNSGAWDYETAWNELDQMARHPKAARLNAVLTHSAIQLFWSWRD